MIKGGKGGANTLTGLQFESRIDLATAISQLPNYEVDGNKVIYKGKLIAELFSKYKLYKNLLVSRGVNYKEHISKQLLPDEAVLIGDTLFIIEMKFQNGPGSVDEKLQTCHFKKRQYEKLLSKIDVSVEYVYVLNDWFKQDCYKDVLEYIKEVGCHYFFGEIPLDFLGLKS